MNRAPSGEPPLRSLRAPDPRVPVLVTGPRTALVMDGTGDVKLQREARGGMLEWGGVYVEGIRLTAPWTVTFDFPGAQGDLSGSLVSMDVFRGGVVSEHRVGDLSIRQQLAPVELGAGPPATGRRLQISAPGGSSPRSGRVVATIEPFLAPVILEGIQPYEYRLATRGLDLTIESHGFGLAYHSDPLPSRLFADAAPWIGGRRLGELRSVRLEYDVTIDPGSSACLDWIITGGLGRAVPTDDSVRGACLAAIAGSVDAGAAREVEWTRSTPAMSLPGLPTIEQGYRLARGALHQLYQTASPEMTGLVAGYPWYAALWGRDLGWMLPAVLWLGDFERVAQSLRTIFRYQSHARLPILGAAAGELPMQVTSGPIFLYGTSDSTLYPAGVLRRFLDHTGRDELLGELAIGLERAGAWADAKVDPRTGLFTHGGEVATMKAAVEDAGRIHYGFDAVDTTIWDSTDRRDHALDMQVLYLETLRARAVFAGRGGDPAAARGLTQRADALAGSLAARYAWAAEEYLYDSLLQDGTPVSKVRPNALRAVSAGVLPLVQSRAAVRRAAREDLTTPWGLRTLSSAAPTYDPQAYHDGQVWTIATAWAADAALAVGEIDLGLSYLDSICQRFVAEAGLANECYRGDRPEAYDSCFLLGFSVAPFLTTLFERLWGLRPALADGTLRIEPALPAHAGACRLTGLSLGGGTLDLGWAEGVLDVRWQGAGPIRILRGDTDTSVAPGQTVSLDGGPAR
ncbi:MAG: hypothetical protein L3K17_08340 [Thermoplasmata archaeon]|nr:hypothetical protein [Thermoplasmata archaeon]